ncbi:efflux RND transporter permease subunit [Ramlibacter sp. Leaf400]|uniref:efflux RND transporter permease subunit n=1 Tax=Ramlibacter sp. Leaf400 TaxID=1736365 RepID=UPI0006FDB986|nr:multidrug efflux RND transporter permease subunit [Ramlibacter sp. Leaf400]KQT09515.1 transporter [Ramlibacter sp. Leaf400]
MKLARIFIDRPIVAIVLSLVILLAGLASMGRLPLTEYPNVMPPTVNVTANYPGANPGVIADTVATPLETELNGLPGLQYMSSQSTGDGRYALSLTFAQGTDPARAETEVQNRVARMLSRLPVEVQRTGVAAEKVSPDILMVVHLVSPDNRYDLLHLSNFAQLNIRDRLLRVPGVRTVAVWGAGEYSLRVWLDPERMLAYGLTAGDVVSAIREQNMQVAAGSVGQPDTRSLQQLPLSVTGRLSSPEAFRDIVVRTGTHGEQLKLSSVARIELGASQYSLRSLLDNQPAVALQITQDPSASALEVAKAVRAEMERLQKDFPQGIEHRVAYDPTLFVQASISNVLQTLGEAIALVVLVVLLFLQNWRASLIPIAAVPVSLVGTLAVMHLLGFSLNTLSLFGLVMAIGIVVDDAIVVVENVERHLADGLAPREAALRAMQEVTGPILVITAVLAAVFIPTAFMGGLSGEFYRQFALTIAISTILSALNSLTLSPALAALLLKPHGAGRGRMARWLGGFNRGFDALASRYALFTGQAVRRSARLLVLYGALIALTVLAFKATPTGFVPAQDKYFLVGIVQLPPGASLDRTEAVTREMTRITLEQPGIESVVAFPGLSINGFVNSPSAAVVFAMLDPFEQRSDKSLSAGAIAGALNGKFGGIDDGFAAIFPPPPVPGLGQTGGFKLHIQDKARLGPQELEKALQRVMAAAGKDKRLAGLMSGYQAQVPKLSVEIDREKARAMGVPMNALAEAMQVYLGSLYVNDFNYLGRAWQVNVQADAAFRSNADAVSGLWTRNGAGQMVPLAAMVNVRTALGPDPISRYNGVASADLSGGPAPGVSAGDALAAMQEILARELPEGFSYEWTDLTYQQMREGSSGLLVFPLAVALAFLILAAAYGSWSLPAAVLGIVPTVLLGALAGVWATGGDNNLFTQIAFVVLIGLATKNAILIVEFARRRQQEGQSPIAAVVEAARLRLRPILMTSLAFIMGVMPLVFAAGAGAEMRQAVGVAVFAGMVAVTLAGLVFTPLFFVLLQRRSASSSLEVRHA